MSPTEQEITALTEKHLDELERFGEPVASNCAESMRHFCYALLGDIPRSKAEAILALHHSPVQTSRPNHLA